MMQQNSGSNTEARSNEEGSSSQSASTITLPKSGGAIKGISEKFSANPVTGTSSFSIHLPVSPARGFEPQLALSYDSGADTTQGYIALIVTQL